MDRVARGTFVCGVWGRAVATARETSLTATATTWACWDHLCALDCTLDCTQAVPQGPENAPPTASVETTDPPPCSLTINGRRCCCDEGCTNNPCKRDANGAIDLSVNIGGNQGQGPSAAGASPQCPADNSMPGYRAVGCKCRVLPGGGTTTDGCAGGCCLNDMCELRDMCEEVSQPPISAAAADLFAPTVTQRLCQGCRGAAAVIVFPQVTTHMPCAVHGMARAPRAEAGVRRSMAHGLAFLLKHRSADR